MTERWYFIGHDGWLIYFDPVVTPVFVAVVILTFAFFRRRTRAK